MTLWALSNDNAFTEDMTIYTNISSSRRFESMEVVEQRVTDRLIAHGYTLPATVLTNLPSVVIVAGTGVSKQLNHLIHRETEIDLLTAGGNVPSRAEGWQKELDDMWGDIKGKRFITSHFFSDTPTSTAQRGKMQTMRIQRS